MPIETRSYELCGLAPVGDALLAFDAVLAAATSAVAIPYEAVPDGSSQKRLLAQSRTLYATDDRSGPLPFGEVESLALPWQTFAKAFTPALLTSALGGRATDAILTEGGYVRFLADDDAWWVPSGRAAFSGPATFYLANTFVDPFGNTSSVVYDAYSLAVLQATSPVGNTVAADHDYRVLSPVHVTDANGNRAAAKFDELGRVVSTAVMGKIGEADGDTLADPTTTFDYDLTRFATTGKPSMVHGRAREEHGAGNTRWQETYSYSDGSGHEVMRKVPAEPGDTPRKDDDGKLIREADGTPATVPADPRWVGTGRTVFDNKGNPVKQYEPFFSPTHEYEDEPDIVEQGVTPILRYDPLGRLVRTDLPNGTFSKIEFDPWTQTTFDPNDNIAPLDPSNTTGESLWYQARKGLDPVTDPEGRAAALAYAHRSTPGVAHLDALGRTFLTIEDNGAAGIHATRRTLDLEGNPLRITDARGNGTTTTYAYDPETFRLVRLKTVRDSDDEVLQNLACTYDPVGNITEIKDSAPQTVFFDNDVVTPSTRYVYDALYRLIQATGREHAGGMADVQRDQNDVPLRNLPHANDAQAVRNYIEQYVYDAVGNIVSMRHTAGAGR